MSTKRSGTIPLERIRSLALLIAIVGTAPTTAPAQTVIGHLYEEGTRRPIVLGDVALVDTLRQAHDRTLTDHDGAFQLVAQEPGSYYLMASSIGYELNVAGVLELEEGGQIEVEFYLKPAPVEVERIQVTGEQVQERLAGRGFYDRMQVGMGRFFTSEEIEEDGSSTISALLNQVPGIYDDQRIGAGRGAVGSGRIYFRDQSPALGCAAGIGAAAAAECGSSQDPPGFCTPILYIDGARVGNPQSGADVDAAIGIRDVAGIEIYTRASQAPQEFLTTDSTCGAILVWTKQGAGR